MSRRQRERESQEESMLRTEGSHDPDLMIGAEAKGRTLTCLCHVGAPQMIFKIMTGDATWGSVSLLFQLETIFF